MAIIEINELSFAYPSEEGDAPKKPALDGVSFSIEAGTFVAVLGHNGSGKSTLAKHLNAILLPTAGTVHIDGIDTRDADKLFDVRARAGMVFQNPDNQLVATVVEEDVAFACENMGLEPALIRTRVDESLAAVGMSKYHKHAPHLLSGGQKQRVAIAGVLAMQPQVLIMDEPTAMLDPSGRKEVLRTIHRLNRETGMTVVLITHHMDEAAQADRVVVMHEGKVVLDDKPEQVFSQVQLMEELSLSVPQTVQLLDRLNAEGGGDLPLGALSVAQCAQEIRNYLGE